MAIIAEGEFYNVRQADTGEWVIHAIGRNRSDIWRYITAEEAGRFADLQSTNNHDRSFVDATCRAILSEFYDKDRL
jgi:hypothetical protein